MSPMTMIALPLAPAPAELPPLIRWIDFKWLMAGEGHRVHLERLQVDSDYARRCLALAEASRSATLRWAAGRLAAAVLAMPATPLG